MLDILPFLTWLAAIASGILLGLLWSLGAVRRTTGMILLGWFLLAGYCQFFGGSPVVSAVGLSLQTVLAIGLTIRWKAGH